MSRVNCIISEDGIVSYSGASGDYYIVYVRMADKLSGINVYITKEKLNKEINGVYYAESVWIEDIYDCSAPVLEIAREYLRFYSNDLFICEASDLFFKRKY